MRYLLVLFLGALLFLSGLFAQQMTRSRDGDYRLTWQEDFNGHSLDTSSWSYIPRHPWSWAYYLSDDPSVYEVRRGRLRLYARRNQGVAPQDTASYLCGGVYTHGHHTISYGKIEVRARIHGAVGCWPAIWTLREDNRNDIGDKGYQEIDLMEHLHYDKEVHHTVHNYYNLHQNGANKPPKHTVVPCDVEKYNVYTLEIRPGEIIMSINGRETFRYPHDPSLPETQYPFGVPVYLMLDMQVSGSAWVKELRPETFPAWMDIDWVKFYELIER